MRAVRLAASGALRFDEVITKESPLEAAAINGTLDSLARFAHPRARLTPPSRR
ncbi:MAG: hypothetical protein ACOC0E_12590 [Spirochaetota bacterium]